MRLQEKLNIIDCKWVTYYKKNLRRKEMQNIKKIICFIVVLSLVFPQTILANAKAKNIDVQILKVDKRIIKIQITNKNQKSYLTTGFWQLKRKYHGKWKKIKMRKNVKMPKSFSMKKNSSIIVKIKWKNYFGKNLKKGTYKICYVKSKKFTIK